MAQPEFAGGDGSLRGAAWIGIAGCAAVVVANLVGTAVVPGHSWIEDTISNLAAGRYAWIQDAGLIAFAIGIAALALGLWRLDLGGGRWLAGAVCLAAFAVDIVVIAMRDEYGTPQGSGVVFHSALVWLLGGLFVLALWLLSKGLGQVGAGWRKATNVIAAAWLVLSPPFFLIPTGFDGLYERGLALLVIGWMIAVAVLLLQEGRAR